MYCIRILDNAARRLSKLDKTIGRRIVKRIQWLAANINNIRPEALTGDFSGLYKFRVGDYRIIYEILHNEQVIIIYEIGHRKEIYQKR